MNVDQLPQVRITRIGNMFKRPVAMVVDPSAEQEHPYIPLNTVYLGVIPHLPKVGERIICSYHTKDSGNIGFKPSNILITTTIISIDGDNFHTQNSVYKIELLNAN